MSSKPRSLTAAITESEQVLLNKWPDKRFFAMNVVEHKEWSAWVIEFQCDSEDYYNVYYHRWHGNPAIKQYTTDSGYGDTIRLQ